jgi:hypothetical protein
MSEKPDISKNFHFETIERGSYVYRIGSGQLGVPGMIKLHRSKSAQSSVSSGTGDDAGHLIGNRFGAPGGAENLGPQSWIQNQYGTFKQLENTWEARLKQGVAIRVLVEDVFRKNANGQKEGRPFMRRVEWDETLKKGLTVHHELVFANPQTAKSRDARDIAPTVAPGNVAKVYDFFSRRRIG